MKTFFGFVVVLLLIITFSGKAPLKPYRDAFCEQVLLWLPANWQGEDQAVTVIANELTTLGETLGLGQQEMLASASRDKASILLFRQRYCIDKDFNPILFGEPLQRSCAIIDKHYYRLSGS